MGIATEVLPPELLYRDDGLHHIHDSYAIIVFLLLTCLNDLIQFLSSLPRCHAMPSFSC